MAQKKMYFIKGKRNKMLYSNKDASTIVVLEDYGNIFEPIIDDYECFRNAQILNSNQLYSEWFFKRKEIAKQIKRIFA